MIEILVNGHSGHESTGFSLPNGVSIRFFADPRTTCYVPAMHVANVVQQLRSGGGHLKQPGSIVNDYTIEFNPNEPTEGVFDMQGNKLPDVGNAISLRNLIQGLRQMFDTDIMIYGIFCRGSARESFAGQVAPVSKQVGQQAFLNEEPLDFDMDMGGGKTRRRTKRKTKRKTRRKTKRKRKRKTKKRKRKRRTRKKRGRGPVFSRPAKVAAIGALALGSGAAAVSPAAKQTYQEIMQADCNAPFRQMVKPHHPDKGGTIEDFSFVESARQSRKKSCPRSTQTKTSKPERRSGESGKAARKRHNRTEKARRATEREQADRQEAADRRAGQQNKEQQQEETDSNTRQQAEQSAQEETNYGDLAGKVGATAVALGALEYARRHAGPGYGPNNPRPQRPRTPPRNR